jgi:PKD repeat protein
MKKIITLLGIAIIMLVQTTTAQNYCTPTYNGNGQESRWFCHILGVNFGSINRTFNAPYGYNYPNTIYENFTNYTSTVYRTDVVPTQTYPLSIHVGNGANTQYVTAWIDFNGNQTFESSERILSEIDYENVGDHIVRANVTIPANAAIGETRLRVATNIILSAQQGPPDPCINNQTATVTVGGTQQVQISSQHFQDYTVNILKPGIQTFDYANTVQINYNDEITKGSVDNPILRIEVKTNNDGVLTPLTVDSMYFSSLGSTNPSEIKAAKLYYTGNNIAFSDTHLVATISKPSTYFSFPVDRKLFAGTSYFWLTYDVEQDAVLGNLLDARCNGVLVNIRRIPNTIDPYGEKRIGYCVARGNKSNFVYTDRVTLRDINKTGYPYYNTTTGYYDYTASYSTNLYKGPFHVLSVETGNIVTPNYTKAWIDYNRDGFFDPVNEEVFYDSLFKSGTQQTTGPVVDSFQVPINAVVGPTRMRIISHYDANRTSPPGTPYIQRATPCTNPLEIGEIEDFTVIIADSGQAVADFDATVACFGDPVLFTDKSYIFGTQYQIVDWIWDFGDGDTSHSQNPQHVYQNAGVYNVKLTVITNYTSGVPNEITKAVKINDPKAAFSITSNLYQSSITFVDETEGGTPNKWYWDFGDPKSGYNNYSNSKQPKHIFDTVGNYNVMFIVTVEGNCVDTIRKTIFIDSVLKPIANFSAETFNPYYQQPVQYLDISDYDPTSWEWTVSPSTHTFHNSTRYDEKPIISLDNLGTYVIKLVVRNTAGADSISKIISTKDYIKPIANFSADFTTVKAGQLISFLDESQNDPTSWTWSFGSGDSAFIQHPKYAYYNVGNYTIALTAENPKGQDTRVKSNYVKVTNEYKMCDNDATYSNLFTGHIYDSGGKGENYKDGSSCGFLIKPECAGPITLVFTAFDFAAGDNIKVYDAEFADPDKLLTPVNGISGNTVPNAMVARSGAMYIEESTTASDNQEGFAASWFAVANIKPNATIKADTIGYANGPITFKNNTSLGAGNSYYWDYENDGVYEDSFEIGALNTNGRAVFDSLGYYTIKLKAENCKGADSTTFTIHIIEPTQKPIADFTTSEDTVNEAETIQLTDLSTMGPSTWKWTIIPPDYISAAVFVDGTTDDSQHPRVQFYGIGAYTIQLYVENKIGWDSIVKQKYIYVREKAQMCVPTMNGTFKTSSSAGRLLDSGGDGNYLNNNGPVSCPGITIEPCAEKVYLEFKMFDFAPGDYLRIYDGKDANGKALHPGDGFTATELPPPLLTGESGSVFIQEITNSSVNAPGFIIDWSMKPLARPSASFNAPDTAYTNGNVAFFENTSTGVVDKYYWDYDYDGNVDDSTKFHGEYAYTLTNPSQNIQLRALSCAGESRENQTVVVAPATTKPEADFYANKYRADTSDIIQLFEDSKFGPYKWTWVFNPAKEIYIDPNDTLKARPQLKFDSTGYFDVSLIVENEFGVDTMKKDSFLLIFAYCRPSVQNSLPDFGISRVTINDLDHLSSAEPAYNDYTETHHVTLELGGTYNFTIKSPAAPNPYNRKIWIDLNQDGFFNDTTERLAFITNDNNLIWKDQLSVPATAMLGETRMRVGVDVAGFANLPCGPNTFGEFEDYRVYITEDLTPPVITLKGNRTTLTEVDYPYIDSGAVAYDAVDGDITNKIVIDNTVDTNTIGQYTVTYNVEDSKGNKAEEVVRYVFVTPDRTPPVITLLGDDPVSIQVYYPYTEFGATATDNNDGDVTNKIVIEHTIDTARVDTYSVIYSAYDNNANFASVERTVYVSDSIPPVINLIGPDTLAIKIAGAVNDPGVEVLDNYYFDLSATSTTNVDEGIEGWYWIKYNATDRSGNKAKEVKRIVKVGNPVSTPEIPIEENLISVYPNPTTGIFNIDFDLNKAERIQVSIVNTLGEEVLRKDIRNIQNNNLTFDLSGNAEGVYLVKLLIGHQLEVFRITYVK